MNLVEISHLHLKECVTACSVQYEMVDKGMFTGLKRIWGNQEYWKPWAWRSTLNEPDGRYWSSLCTEPVDRSTLKGLLGTRTEGARLFWGIGDSFASHMELLKFIWPGSIGTPWWLPPRSSQYDDRPVTHQLLTTETILYGQNPQQNRNESDAGSFYHFGQECCNVSRSVVDGWGRKGMTVEKCGAWISVRGQTDIKLPRVTLQMWAPLQMLMIPPEFGFILWKTHFRHRKLLQTYPHPVIHPIHPIAICFLNCQKCIETLITFLTIENNNLNLHNHSDPSIKSDMMGQHSQLLQCLLMDENKILSVLKLSKKILIFFSNWKSSILVFWHKTLSLVQAD